MACFGRNERATAQVWSSWLGYPGDGLYREFHKNDDISGLQYWRVTSRDTDLGAKEIYDPEAASARLQEHAAHFVGLVHELVADWWSKTGEHAVIVAPYDTELFGHWWYEGVEWLGEVLRGFLESTEYGARRFREHAQRFNRLMDYIDYADAKSNERDLEEAARYVGEIYKIDDPFPWLCLSTLTAEDPIQFRLNL